jgi:sugar transferase (PEP-CTERM/EpsH1 system associated)
VAHVVLSLDPGGLERLVVDLVAEGLKRGEQPSVVCLERTGILAPHIEALGAHLACVHKPAGIRPATVRRLRQVFGKLQPHVVHTHQIGALFYAGPAAQRAGVPVVVHTEHGKHFADRRRTRWLGRLAGRYADRFCCVSRDIAREVTRARIVPARKIEVVVNGVDTSRFHRPGGAEQLRHELGIPPNAVVIGTVGRLNEIKRHDLLIRGFAHLATQHGDLHLLVVGDGPLRRELEQLAAAIVPPGRVHFTGYQSEPQRFLQVMNVFALTSRSEGMPLAILEAWAAGVPVVASSVGGVPELVDEGKTGLMFPCDDALALSQAIGQLLRDPDLAGSLATAGRVTVQSRFSLAITVSNYERLYFETLALPKVAV